MRIIRVNEMIVNNNSWHVRLVRWADWTPSKSLCIYFWQVVLSMLLTACLSFIALFFIAICLFIAASPVTALIWDGIQPISWFGALFWVIGLSKELHRLRCARKPTKKKPDSVLVSYVKAKKGKVCPTITFIDGE